VNGAAPSGHYLRGNSTNYVDSAIQAGDVPTLNQSTTGSAASLSIASQTGLLTFTGLTSTNRAKTVRDAADTLLELGGSYTPTGTWTSMTMVTPVLGTPTSGTLTNCTFPTLNQNTTGSAASLSVSGQTGLVTVTGLTSVNRVKTVRDAADTLLELGGSYTPTGTWTSMTLSGPAVSGTVSGSFTCSGTLTLSGTVKATSIFQSGSTQQTNFNASGLITKYNNVTTAGQGVPAIQGTTSLNSGLTANYNSGSAKTILTPTVAGSCYRIAVYQVITVAGGVSSTFPSLTLGFTDSQSVARTYQLIATSTTNNTGVFGEVSYIFDTNGATAITLTSASYASSGTTMTYTLLYTLEQLI
jgi:hypothetical protein